MSAPSSKPKRRPRARKPRGKKKPQPKRTPRSKPSRAGPKPFSSVRMGQRVGNLFGPKVGMVGAEAGRLFRQLTGFGDYKVNGNSLLTGVDRLPTFKNPHSGTRITHREYLFDVVTSSVAGAFKIEQVSIQPALISAFPWLSASAENYQEYKLNGAVYEFKSNSYNALASTNTASGTVVMSTNYNVLDPPFGNKFLMEQSQFTCSAKPSVDLLHPIECAKIETPTSILFTRGGPVSSGDLRLYDWANFFIATVGMQGASTNIGELWVTYDITLLKPKLNSTSDVMDHYSLTAGVFVPAGPAYFGTVLLPPRLTSESDMGTRLLSNGGTGLDTIVWPTGYTGKCMVIYLASLISSVSASLATRYSLVYSGGCTEIKAFSTGVGTNEGGSSPMVYNGNGGTTLVALVNLVNGGALRFVGGTTAGSLSSGDLIINALPTTFNLGALLSTPITPMLYVPPQPHTDGVYTHSVSDGFELLGYDQKTRRL